jgi:hypothetical protein
MFLLLAWVALLYSKRLPCIRRCPPYSQDSIVAGVWYHSHRDGRIQRCVDGGWISYYNNKGDDITKYFIDENNFVADINSYNQGIPSTEYIQAVTDCAYIVFTKTALEELSMTIINWDAIIAKITAKALANRIPLSYIASYLGVTQSSLSRIRKTIR